MQILFKKYNLQPQSMKSILIVGLLVAATLFSYLSLTSRKEVEVSEQAYELYKQSFGKHYPLAENSFRLNLFRTNAKKVAEFNAQGNSWKMGINQFSDMTQEEFEKISLGEFSSPSPNVDYDRSNTVGATDWVAAGVITSIKNQGSCGSCWAFAATAVHESYQVMKNKKDISLALSPQQLVDCSFTNPYNNQGCNGGFGSHALEYIKDNGQTTEEAYPYVALTKNCTKARGEYTIMGVAEITGCTNMENVLTSTPLAVRVDASNWSAYKSGILNTCNENHNHAVLLVGSTSTYWVIKNSWGTNWGESGFIRLAKGNTCGVCFGPSFPF